MTLNPWQLWGKDGKPAEGTEEAISILEEVLRRDPDHVGANHLYIHAVEASPWPERGLPSADRLLRLVPWQGHLVHMPAHIYIHTGDHELAARANELAIKADEDYFKAVPEKGLYRIVNCETVNWIVPTPEQQADEGQVHRSRVPEEVDERGVGREPLAELCRHLEGGPAVEKRAGGQVAAREVVEQR